MKQADGIQRLITVQNYGYKMAIWRIWRDICALSDSINSTLCNQCVFVNKINQASQ